MMEVQCQRCLKRLPYNPDDRGIHTCTPTDGWRALEARIAELEAEVEAAYMRGCEVSEKSWRRDGAEAALRWAWEQGVCYDFPGTEQEWVGSGITALLGEGE